MSPSADAIIFQLSVVLPCYNESRGLQAILNSFQAAGQGVSYELILVNNGSTDDTAAVLTSLLPNYPFARMITVEKNQGYGHGLMTGLESAMAPVLAWSHADLQTDPADIFRALQIFLRKGSEGPLLIKGRRFGRSFGERVISWGMQICATLLLRTPLSEINAQPKLFDRSLLAHLPDPPKDFNFDLYVLFQARKKGWKIESFPVQFPPRQYGESNWGCNLALQAAYNPAIPTIHAPSGLDRQTMSRRPLWHILLFAIPISLLAVITPRLPMSQLKIFLVQSPLVFLVGVVMTALVAHLLLQSDRTRRWFCLVLLDQDEAQTLSAITLPDEPQGCHHPPAAQQKKMAMLRSWDF